MWKYIPNLKHRKVSGLLVVVPHRMYKNLSAGPNPGREYPLTCLADYSRTTFTQVDKAKNTDKK